MKIALLGPIAWRTPPRHYGPWELVTSLLAEGLVARGVDVTLFATLDSVTAARPDGGVPAGELGLRVHLRRRPRARAGVPGHRPPRRRPGAVAVHPVRGRGPGLLR